MRSPFSRHMGLDSVSKVVRFGELAHELGALIALAEDMG